jgi:large subunit ribosomal protein L13e
MVAKNNRVPNDHLRKDWYHRVKTYFDDPARKKRRQAARRKRAQKIAPRPVEGPLRPLVHCPTARYNRRIRLGRGFTNAEVLAAGINPSRARYIGIAVDKFRVHSKDEAIKAANIARLQEYKSHIVRVHGKPTVDADGAKVPSTEKLPDGVPLPGLFTLPKADQEVKWRVISAQEKKQELFATKQKAAKAKKDAIKAAKEEKHKKK